MAFGERSAMQGCVVAENLIRNAPSKCYPRPASLLTHHPNNHLQKTAITYKKVTITYEKVAITCQSNAIYSPIVDWAVC